MSNTNKENVQQHKHKENNHYEAHKKEQTYDVHEVKHQLEAWKFILVAVNNIVEWEKQYDPAIIVAVDSLLFGFIYFYNPAILTTVAMIGLFFLTLEYAVPLLTSYFFKNTEWDNISEAKYTRICEKISNLHSNMTSFKDKVERVRKEKQPLYFLIVFFFLIFCAYIGQSIDNILLTYLAVLVMTLMPGIKRKELLQNAFNKVKATIGMAKSDILNKKK